MSNFFIRKILLYFAEDINQPLSSTCEISLTGRSKIGNPPLTEEEGSTISSKIKLSRNDSHKFYFFSQSDLPHLYPILLTVKTLNCTFFSLLEYRGDGFIHLLTEILKSIKMQKCKNFQIHCNMSMKKFTGLLFHCSNYKKYHMRIKISLLQRSE